MRKSKKLTIGFLISSVILIVAFFVFFSIAQKIRGDYNAENLKYIAAVAQEQPESVINGYKANMANINSSFTILSILTWITSILAIVSVGLGLKLIDAAKEKEEEFDNHFVFEEKEGNSSGGKTAEESSGK